MRKEKDPRINAGAVSLKEYLMLLIMLAVVSAIFMITMRLFLDWGMLDSQFPYVKIVTDVFIFILAALF